MNDENRNQILAFLMSLVIVAFLIFLPIFCQPFLFQFGGSYGTNVAGSSHVTMPSEAYPNKILLRHSFQQYLDQCQDTLRPM